jgi:hypothetical protein
MAERSYASRRFVLAMRSNGSLASSQAAMDTLVDMIKLLDPMQKNNTKIVGTSNKGCIGMRFSGRRFFSALGNSDPDDDTVPQLIGLHRIRTRIQVFPYLKKNTSDVITDIDTAHFNLIGLYGNRVMTDAFELSGIVWDQPGMRVVFPISMPAIVGDALDGELDYIRSSSYSYGAYSGEFLFELEPCREFILLGIPTLGEGTPSSDLRFMVVIDGTVEFSHIDQKIEPFIDSIFSDVLPGLELTLSCCYIDKPPNVDFDSQIQDLYASVATPATAWATLFAQ